MADSDVVDALFDATAKLFGEDERDHVVEPRGGGTTDLNVEFTDRDVGRVDAQGENRVGPKEFST